MSIQPLSADKNGNNSTEEKLDRSPIVALTTRKEGRNVGPKRNKFTHSLTDECQKDDFFQFGSNRDNLITRYSSKEIERRTES